MTQRVKALARCGVTRVSLGVQDFDANVQQAINRIQPFELVQSAVKRLRDAGIANINFDLIYGLPRQTVATVEATIERAAALAPARIALFGYAHVPWMKRHQKLLERHGIPDSAARIALASAAQRKLQERGYIWIGLDHFALPGDTLARAAVEGSLRRNFQGYTTDGADTLIGLGPSAISTTRHGYAQSASELREWSDAISAGRLATRRGIALDQDDRIRRDLIERLMCDLAVDLQDVGGVTVSKPAAISVQSSARWPISSMTELSSSRARRSASRRPAGRLFAPWRRGSTAICRQASGGTASQSEPSDPVHLSRAGRRDASLTSKCRLINQNVIVTPKTKSRMPKQ